MAEKDPALNKHPWYIIVRIDSVIFEPTLYTYLSTKPVDCKVHPDKKRLDTGTGSVSSKKESLDPNK